MKEILKEPLINCLRGMRRKAHGAQKPRHIKRIIEVASTAQRSDSPAQAINQRFLRRQFINSFGKEPEAFFFAPGRVNLIGEHIDYNGGCVFPCALSLGTYAAASKSTDGKIRFYSVNFENSGIIEVDINAVKYKKEDGWTNYPKGVVHVLKAAGHKIETGFDVVFHGDIPLGAGLSSSASIEVCAAVLLDDFYNLKLSPVEMAKISQTAENRFVGMNCGIMDQFASALGKKDNAILLNCDTLEYKYVPLELKDATIVIADTNKSRELAGSKYNERRAECGNALKMLQKSIKIKDLCELTPDTFEEHRSLITDRVAEKRAKHAVYENARTLKAFELLNNKDIDAFGKLMNDSHVSLRDDYEVSCKELDVMTGLAWKQKGVMGARMTGAGFGGCAVCIVKTAGVEDFKNSVGIAYENATGLKADFYTAQTGRGAGKL